jgi:predicted ATP-grasp superfamily ATP-dependent carboligase
VIDSLEFINKLEPEIKRPLVIAAMQDMGNVGSIVVNFINKSLGTTPFRHVKSTRPPYVYDRGGFIEIPEEKWEYRFGSDFIIFGGGPGQPQQNDAKFIYTVGGFHTSRQFGKHPTTYVTTTSKSLLDQVQRLGIETTPQESVITGFNGLILGYAKLNGINGMGLYGELLEPNIPQYRAAKSIIQTLEKLTYQKLGNSSELDAKADAVDNQLKGSMKDDYDF